MITTGDVVAGGGGWPTIIVGGPLGTSVIVSPSVVTVVGSVIGGKVRLIVPSTTTTGDTGSVPPLLPVDAGDGGESVTVVPNVTTVVGAEMSGRVTVSSPTIRRVGAAWPVATGGDRVNVWSKVTKVDGAATAGRVTVCESIMTTVPIAPG
jgi:hypothetical protein